MDGAAFRRGACIVGALVLVLLVAGGIVIANMSAHRREDAVAAEVERLVAAVPWPHREYLSPRIGVAGQLISMLASETAPSPASLRDVAAAALRHDPLRAVALLRYRTPDPRRSWTLREGDDDLDLQAVERRLDQAFLANPGITPAIAADLEPWGRTLVLRFPVGGADEQGSIIEAIRLDPLYAELFVPRVRADFTLQIYDETGLVWGEALEPPPEARVATRSFPVAGQRWTVRAWPRVQWLAAQRAQEWWALARVGLPMAPLLAGALVAFLLWWGRLTAKALVAEQRTYLVVDGALDAVVGMDAAGKISGWNAQAALMFGWSASEAIGRPLAETIVPPQYRDAHNRGLARFLEAGEGRLLNQRVDLTGWHRNGREFPIELSISPIRVRDTYSFTAFVRDITERKRSEEELRSAKESAEAANKAKSEFLATMSHEIRTPMNGIFGMTELALDAKNDAERRDFLVRARACAESLMAIINDVLDFSKIEAGKLDFESIEFEVRAVLDGVLDTLAIEASRKQLELVGFVDEGLPARLRGDPGRLRQIIMNLAGNALKFTDHGEIVIRLERAAAEPADGTPPVLLRCTVRDTGIGIPRDKQEAIFESFTQADSSTTRRYGGTGLGLAISQRLVAMMGGTIGVESEPGRGSTFWFNVRFEAAGPARPTQIRRALPGLRVLVVDDNATNRMFLLRTLQGWGCRPSLASGGAEAFDLLTHAARSGEPFDLVLLDMQMPEIDGPTTARRIRAEAATRLVPIVALTSIGRSVAESASELGFSALLPKPIKQAQLLETVVAAAAPHAVEPGPRAVEPAAPPRILVVDDNEANRIVAETVLRRAGYDVRSATGGQEAIAAAERVLPDLILMDVQMPDVDGLAATAAIRAREGTARRTPIVALTAGTSSDDRGRCLAAGMNGYVVKPLRREDLLAAVEAALVPTGQQAARPPAAGGSPRPAAAPEEDAEPLDAELLGEITARFLDDAIARCKALRDAAASGEAKIVEQIGHYIKGAAAQLELQGVRDLAAALEALGRNGHLDSAGDLVTILEGEITSARRQVAEPLGVASGG